MRGWCAGSCLQATIVNEQDGQDGKEEDDQSDQKDQRDQDDQDYQGDVEAPHDVVHIVVAWLNFGLRGDRVQPGVNISLCRLDV